MNHCSQNCSYCADIIKNSTIPLPDPRLCQDFVDQAADHARGRNQLLSVNLTGGEVTEWPALDLLIDRLWDHQARISLRTNASASTDRYREIFAKIAELRLEFHPEYQKISHFAAVISQAQRQGLDIHAQIFMIPERFSELEAMIHQLEDLYPKIKIERRLLFSDPAVNLQPRAYTEPQLDLLRCQHGDLSYWFQDQYVCTDYVTLVLAKQNTFLTQQCSAGLEQIVIDAWGRVYRGHCRQNGLIGRVGQQILWPQDSVICQQSTCRNAFDLQATKQQA